MQCLPCGWSLQLGVGSWELGGRDGSGVEIRAWIEHSPPPSSQLPTPQSLTRELARENRRRLRGGAGRSPANLDTVKHLIELGSDQADPTGEVAAVVVGLG